jgi:TPR repeat protein
MNQVVDKLKAFIAKTTQLSNSSNVNQSDTNNCLLYEKLSRMIDINITKEIEPTTKDIHNVIFEEDLCFVIDEFVNIYFKEMNEGKEESVCKKNAFDYINKCNINLQEIYNWLLNNQNNSNSIYLLGYFNYHGIVIDVNKKKALKLYEKAAELENNMAQFKLVYMYKDGEGGRKNYDKAFKLSKKLAESGHLGGLNLLGYCYCSGIGTEIDMQKAFELYQKATDLGNPKAQYNLALMYEFGEGVEIDFDKAFELVKKSAEGGYLFGIALLGCYYNLGIGTNVDMKKAFELYQKAAILGNYDAQYHLALLYEYGNGVEKDINQAIYWYKKSAKQGFQNALNKLESLQNNFS